MNHGRDGFEHRKVILVEDDAIARKGLELFLQGRGYVVHSMTGGAHLLEAVRELRPDAVIVDLHLPGEDGVALVARLRKRSSVPVIVFTVDEDTKRHVESLNCGADAFINKGVDLRVVDATLQRLVTRSSATAPQGDDSGWHLRTDSWHLIAPGGKSVRLTASEFYLLSALAGSAPEVVSREKILEAQGKPDTLSNLRNLDVYVARLRAKVLADAGVELPVRSIYAAGFAFTEPLEAV